MRNRRGRIGLILLAACCSAAGCGSSHTPAAQPANATSAPTTAAATSTTTTVDPAKLGALLLTTSDLPAGFTAAANPPPAPVTLAPCGHALTPLASDVPQAQAAFGRNGDQEQIAEQVGALGTTAATDLVGLVGQTAGSCHQFDQTSDGKTVTLLLTPIRSPAVADEVAGVQLATSARFMDVVVIRAGGTAAVLVITEVGNPMPAATLAGVVTAAGAKLATGAR